MTCVIKDEVSDLLRLYSTPLPSRLNFGIALAGHYIRFGRVGSESHIPTVVSSINSYYKDFQEHPHLHEEREFLESILSQDLEKAASNGLLLAQSVLPRMQYKQASAILVLDLPVHFSPEEILKRAATINDSEFAIDLRDLYDYVTWEKREKGEGCILDEAVHEALYEIESLAAHESTHVYLNQIRPNMSGVNWLFNCAFSEGLATFVQPRQQRSHKVYSSSIPSLLELVDAAAGAWSDKERLKALSDIIENETLKNYIPLTCKKASAIMARHPVLNSVQYDSLLLDLIYDSRAIYEIGAHMWRIIDQTLGREELRSRVALGTVNFLKVYKSITRNQTSASDIH